MLARCEAIIYCDPLLPIHILPASLVVPRPFAPPEYRKSCCLSSLLSAVLSIHIIQVIEGCYELYVMSAGYPVFRHASGHAFLVCLVAQLCPWAPGTDYDAQT